MTPSTSVDPYVRSERPPYGWPGDSEEVTTWDAFCDDCDWFEFGYESEEEAQGAADNHRCLEVE